MCLQLQGRNMLRPNRLNIWSLLSHGENRYPLDRFAGTLRVEIERPQRLDVVSPPLEPRRCRHPKPIHVEDPAAYAELRYFCDGRDANVAHGLKSLDRLAEGTAPRSLLPLRQDETHGLKRPRHPGALSGGACGRDQRPDVPG